MSVMPGRLDRGFFLYQQEFEQKALAVLRSGHYVLGEEVAAFERELAAYAGSRFGVGVACGLDALCMAFRVLGIGAGDEVIVPANTYIASVMGVTMNGATPVLVEPDAFFQLDPERIEERLTPRTKAVLVVHLYGQPADMGAIMSLARRYHLRVVEDCAQSHGARFGGQMTGTFGDIGCFSFYPTKNLGAFGDAGAILTDDPQLADRMRVLRNYGSRRRYENEVVGVNSRLDELQAGLLRVRLSHLDELNEQRRRLCERYLQKLHHPLVQLPQVRTGATAVWHQFVVRCPRRTALMAHLQERGIETLIHYPIPPHLSQAYACLGLSRGSLPLTEQLADEVLSLPLYTGMTRQEQDEVIAAVNDFGG